MKLFIYLHTFGQVLGFLEPIFFSIIDVMMPNCQSHVAEVKEYG